MSLASLLDRLQRVLEPKIRLIRTKERPDRLIKGKLYVTEAGGQPAFGFMSCPCGCGETLHLRFAGERRPRWSVVADWLGRATVKPSVWRSTGCKSHFILTKGRIHWV